MMTARVSGYEYDKRAASVRWIAACAIAGGGTLLFLLLVIRPEPVAKLLLPPLIELGYVTLPAEPKPPPKPPKPVVQKQPEAPQPPVETPVTEMPMEPSESSPVLADVTARPVPTPAPAPVVPVRITSFAALDNTEFSPLVMIKPAYPPIALKAGIEGYVNVDLLVNEKGQVESFSIVDVTGHPAFGNETAKVLKKWRFPPPRIRGKKVTVQYLYRVNFTMN
jgi:protein TonB